MPTTTYGRKIFGLREVKVRKSGNTPWITCPVAQRWTVTPENAKGVFEGDDARQGGVSFIIGGKVEIDEAAMSLEALSEITAYDLVESGTTPTRTKTLSISNHPMPYFEAQGRSVADAGDGVYVHCFKLQIDVAPPIEMKYGAVYVGKFSAAMFCDETQLDLAGNPKPYEVVQQETATALP